ncbi:MAG: FmdE family protein [Candidatus Bathyarchaeota archaeon]
MVKKQKPPTKITPIIKMAKDLHGHLGPFLTLGVRMSTIALKKLKTKKATPN